MRFVEEQASNIQKHIHMHATVANETKQTNLLRGINAGVLIY